MKLHVINTGFFKLDGGAMFGVVPKTVWSKTNPADENNLCTWAMRCLLVEDGKRLILIDNGIGDKQDAKFFSYYYLHGNQSLKSSLRAAGFSCDDVTDMFLTHLHFDHCGGSIEYSPDRSKLLPVFKNAVYWSNAEHWQWATAPNAREKASFLRENILPIRESGQLRFVEKETEPGADSELGPQIAISYMRGHTDAMMLPHIQCGGKTVVFVADLLPSAGHIPLPYVMGYDTRPLLTLEEKTKFLTRAAREGWVLFFEHDSVSECCTVKETEKGVRMDRAGTLKELLGV
jgi:glyoxylase-like metal-dependent hydrolase (beta-lactamase superfamily II)